jgi:hypothetical protein
VDHRKKLISAAAVLALLLATTTGCAKTRWAIVKHFRAPGEELTTFPEQVWKEYDCESQKRPFFIIEKNELSLQTVIAGSDFGHRLIYVMCPVLPTQVVEGTLSTRIRYKGDPIVRQTDSHFEIKPGRWTVDAIVHLPEDAEPGVYAYELEFEGDPLFFNKGLTFVVVAR